MEKLPGLISFLQKLVSDGKTPGLQYLAVKDGEVVYQQNVGIAEFERDRPVTENSFFNACSVTKTFTSLGIMQLAEAGKIRLGDYASTYLGHLPFQQEIKISQLLSHTSGLSNPIPLRWAHLQEEEENFDYNAFINGVLEKHSKMKFTPGKKFSYSNLNYLPLGQIIEKVSGLPYRDYIRQNIINRLGLTSEPLDFLVFDDSNYARGYQRRFTAMNLILGLFLDKKKFTTRSSDPAWIRFNKYYVSGRAYGGLIANAYSLTKFLCVLFRPDSKLLSEDWRKLLFEKQKTLNGREIEMTLGWFTGALNGVKYFTHAGAGGGYYCEMRMYPQKNLATAIMFNRSGMGDERFLDRTDRHLLH
jgi:CubicO group peptidase (beta-lactamase class C family)